MWKCLFIKRKLYDYLENSLSEIERIKVEKHLKTCNRCQDNLSQLKVVIDLAAKKKTPQPDSDFWHDFRIDLDRKINERLVPPIKAEYKLRYLPKPVFVYVSILIFILVIGLGSYFYKNLNSNFIRIAQQDKNLIEEILTLDELEDNTLELNDNADLEMDLEEIILYS
jgi:hypothetical protein